MNIETGTVPRARDLLRAAEAALLDERRRLDATELSAPSTLPAGSGLSAL